MSNIENKYKPLPFWSWNDELDPKELVDQIEWMHENGIGGFFMHARTGLKTPYLKEKWFECVEACLKKAKELNMEAYAYDENGWPSGFAGGFLLEDENNRDMYLTRRFGPYDPNAVASFEITDKTYKRVFEGDNVLNVYTNVSTSTADVCNEEVVRKFLDLTHEKYKEHDVYKNLRGFFTDEPQYYRWGVPFSRVLPKYFKEKYSEDIFDRIALIFYDLEDYKDFRYKYLKSLHELFINSFCKQVYDWCDKNGYKLTGHFIEENSLGGQLLCCGDIMACYEYEHIPGIDFLGRDTVTTPSGKQLGSVAAQLGKKQTLAEIFAAVGWDCTPRELKALYEYLMQSGVTLLCHHLLPYHEHGERKRDYPEHYSKINPWVNESFKQFNDYFSEIGKLITLSKEEVNVALFNPIRSTYFAYNWDSGWAGDFGAAEITKAYCEIIEKLSSNGVSFHIIDETIMANHAYVEGDSLVVGKCKYNIVMFPPKVSTMDKTSEKLLREYSSKGGKFCVTEEIPTYLEGKKFNHDYINKDVSLEEVIENNPTKMTPNPDIKFSLRVDEKGNKFIYAANIHDVEVDVTIECNGYTSFIHDGKVVSNKLHFDSYESKILYLSNEQVEEKKENNKLYLGNNFKVIGSPLNYLTLDYLSYSKDGINYKGNMHFMAVFNNLLKEKYEGNLYLKYNFDIKDIPSECELLIEDTNIIEVTINGNKIFKEGTVLEKDLWKYNISKHLKEGQNEIIALINFFEDENIYYALFGENVTESLKNCIAYNTTIEPIYLRGNFGVGGDFKDGRTPDTVVGENFYLTTQNKNITNLIKDGYPFFRGKIVLEQEFDVNDINQTLVIDKRFQQINLFINDVFVKTLMFDYKVDISKYLKLGKNVAKLELIVSNRNLLGPHHAHQEEVKWVGPENFERFGTWNEEGESPLHLKRYSFVKTIV